MGMFNNLFEILKIRKDKTSILVLGLNNSGKSTMLNHFKRSKEQCVVVPTVGFMVEQFYKSSVSVKAIDMSGGIRYRNLWEHQFNKCQGIIFVIDSSDKMRFVVVKDELMAILQHPGFSSRTIPILFFANKIDYEDSFSSVKIAAALNLENIRDKPWHICSSNAISGEGLEEGIQWLVQQIRFSMLSFKNSAKVMSS